MLTQHNTYYNIIHLFHIKFNRKKKKRGINPLQAVDKAEVLRGLLCRSAPPALRATSPTGGDTPNPRQMAHYALRAITPHYAFGKTLPLWNPGMSLLFTLPNAVRIIYVVVPRNTRNAVAPSKRRRCRSENRAAPLRVFFASRKIRGEATFADAHCFC